MNDYYVRVIGLPRTVDGVTVPNGDGSFSIYINARLSERQQRETLEHELRHVERDHFYTDRDLRLVEQEAEHGSVNVVLRPPEGRLPCFPSEAALADWLKIMRNDEP